MSILFNNYQCTICRRTKSVLDNSTHAFMNGCTITKGCEGKLYWSGISSTDESSAVPVSEQWVSRWAVTSTTAVTKAPVAYPLVNSPNGAFVVAVRDHGSLPDSATITVEQKKFGEIDFTSYTYSVTAASTTVSGQDAYGKILRIPQSAIDGGLVQVRVNGIIFPTERYTLSTTSISFAAWPPGLSAGDTVGIVVYSSTPVVVSELSLTRNTSLIPSTARGGWSNVGYVYLNGDSSVRWVLYSVDTLSGLIAGSFKITSSDLGLNGFILMSNSPHGQRDRILVSGVEFIDAAQDYNLYVALEGNVLRLYAYDDMVSTCYPPIMLLTDSSFIKADDFYTAAASLQLDNLSNSSITNPTILGPI